LFQSRLWRRFDWIEMVFWGLGGFFCLMDFGFSPPTVSELKLRLSVFLGVDV
jgi:hypothetical protein